MFRRAPKYTVTTLALVFIAVAAFSLKFASRYLPERKPNKLDGEYGEYVLRSKRQNVNWYPFGTAAFEAAKSEDKVIVLDVGTTVSLAAKAFSEDYATDAEYQRLLHDHFVSVKVDALEFPWLVDALSLESDSFAALGRFELIAMDNQGAILAATELKPRAGDGSLAGWLEDIARLRYSNRAQLRARAAASFRLRKEAATNKLSHGAADLDMVDAWSVPYERAAVQGEFNKGRLPVGTLLMEVLTGTSRSEAWGSGLAMMEAMIESPAFDCVGGGFFVMAGNEGWKRPVTSKMPSHSLQIAAAYADAAERFDLPLFRWVAFHTASWAVGMLEGGLFVAADSTDQLNGSSPRYALAPADVSGLPIDLDDDGLPSISGATSFAEGVSLGHTQVVSAAAEKLLAIRNSKPETRIDSRTYANLNGQAIAGLFRIGAALKDQNLLSEASRRYAKATATFVLPLGDVRHAPEGSGDRNGYAPDYAWLVRASLDGYLATGNPQMLANAETIAGRMLELFQGEEGAIASYLPSLLEWVGFGFPVYRSFDAELPSVNAVASMALSDLAALTGKSEYGKAAQDILMAFSGAFLNKPAPLGFVLAGRRLYEPLILVNGTGRPTFPRVRIAMAPSGRFKRPGLYLATSQKGEGPLTASEIRARLSIQ